MIPKRKIVEFTDWINNILEENREVLPIRELEIEANKIQPYSWLDWKVALGMIEALKFNIPGVEQHFNAAIRAGGDQLVYSNYASAYLNIGCNIKGNQIMEDALSKFDDYQTIKDALDIFVEVHNYERAENLISNFEGLINPDQLAEYQGKIELLESLYTSYNVTWQDMGKRLQLASEFILSKTNHLKKVTESVDENSIFFEFYINDEIDTIAEIELSLQEYLAAVEYTPIDSLVSFALTRP